MSNEHHNKCFYGKIRKILAFWLKKSLQKFGNREVSFKASGPLAVNSTELGGFMVLWFKTSHRQGTA